ncbi:hypothetical protein [Micromonospora sp. NPDC007230]|uniref:hypothetical protein n=1 Tax=Micromonospora sp. NPDC007230 TaxID=3364237 RepID=UPI0036A1CE0C
MFSGAELTYATSAGRPRGLSRAVAVLTAMLVASTFTIFVAAGPAAAKGAPGIPGAYYPSYTYKGVQMTLSRPYVWLDKGTTWTYGDGTRLKTWSVSFYDNKPMIRNFGTGRMNFFTGLTGWEFGVQLVLQPDSNLVVYTEDSRAVWATGIRCNNAAGQGSVLALQNDGNMVVYCTSGWGYPQIVSVAWASGIT